MKTRQLVTDAMLSAVCAVLGYLALDTGNIKVTFETLPILLGAILFGPVDGLAIGTVGTLVYQLIRYGVSATTVLWILPYSLCGLLLGLISKKNGYHLNGWKLLTCIVGMELMITVLNTGVLYVDSHIYGYYSPAFIFGSLALRLVICIVKAILFSAVLPAICAGVEKVLQRNKKIKQE